MIRLTTILIVFALCSASASASKTNNAESALSAQKIGAAARLRSTIRKLEDAGYYQQEEEEEEAVEYYEEEEDEAEEEEEEDEEAAEYYEEEEEEAAEEDDDAAAEEGDDAAAEGDDDAAAEGDDDAEDDDAEDEYYDGGSSSISQKARDYSTQVTNKVNNDYLPEGYDITENELIYFVTGSIGAIALVIIYLSTREASQGGKEGDDYVRSDLIKNEDGVSA